MILQHFLLFFHSEGEEQTLATAAVLLRVGMREKGWEELEDVSDT